MIPPIEGEDQLLAALRARTPARGHAKRFAHELGVSAPFLSRVLHGVARTTPAMAKVLGFRKIVRWERIEE